MCINIDEINQTVIILIVISITYLFIRWQTLPDVITVLSASNSMKITTNVRFLKRGTKSLFCQRHAQGLFITLGYIGYCTGSTYSLEKLLNSNTKPISLSKFGLTLKLICRSVLAPGIVNFISTVLFLIFCAGNRFKHGKPNNK